MHISFKYVLYCTIPSNGHTSLSTALVLKVKDRVCFALVFITYNKLYMYIASISCKTSVTSVLYHLTKS